MRKNTDPGAAPDFSPGKRDFKPACTLGIELGIYRLRKKTLVRVWPGL